MRRIGWALVNALLHTLTPDERDAMQGDIVELQTPVGRALLDVSGLVLRRQAQLFLGWRPWLALWGVAVPLAMVIALVSRWFAEGAAIHAFIFVNNWSPAMLESPGARHDLATVVVTELVGFATLFVWSWTMGFMIGSVSRTTAWVSAAAFAGVLFGELLAVSQPHHPGVAAAFESVLYSAVLPLLMRTLLVFGPMVWGLRAGARRVTPGTVATMVVAIVAAILTVRAARSLGFVATGGWWRLRADWQLQLFHAMLWAPIAYLVAATFVASSSAYGRARLRTRARP